ncbi:sulfite exporter TauE/SafE family protein [Lentibacillus sp. Marseille-P4043]|uniref:sulfite exporter TauE/SafE family protein n=1 Tax=Lentibacillus sp. Marseille-P4043 TaxID=2040293 RepID=UPI000D0BC295|nr:sulfite exporter TauE/SafE family protein [Lentibacillus sp. Marseille-P4043]
MAISTGLCLLLIGLAAGTYGMMVGAGGGFILVPVLLLMFNLSPQVAAGTGLAVVLINAVSGAYGYIKQQRINYQLGVNLTLGAIPGTFIGVWLTQVIPPQSFKWVFGFVLVALGIFLLVKRKPKTNPYNNLEDVSTSKVEIAADSSRALLQVESNQFLPRKSKMLLLLLIGILLGTVSSFFGIGGGWLMVPILIYILHESPHSATATSVFSLSIYSAVGVGIHLFHGNINWTIVFWSGMGVLAGAQLGVYLSTKISNKLLIQMLSIVLIGVGIKMFLSA